MPLYEYQCRGCGERFEYLVRGDDKPSCPACDSRELDKQMSVPSAPQIAGGPQCGVSRGNRPCDSGGGCGGCPCAGH